MRITITINVNYDCKERSIRELDQEEICDAITGAVSSCRRIENEASVEVSRIQFERD